jgi:hypothetical protein
VRFETEPAEQALAGLGEQDREHGEVRIAAATCGSPTTPPPTRSTSTSPATRSRRAAPPSRPPRRPASKGFVALDWKDDRLVGIEIFDVSTRLHPDFLEEAEILS